MRKVIKKVSERLTFFKSLRFIFFIIIFLVGMFPCTLLQNAILRDYEARAVEVRVEQVKGQLRSLANHLISSNYLINQDSGQVDAELSEFSTLYDGRLLIIDDSLRVVKDTYGLADNKTIVSEDVISCLQSGDRAGSEKYDREYAFLEIAVPIMETRSMEGLDYVKYRTGSDGNNAGTDTKEDDQQSVRKKETETGTAVKTETGTAVKTEAGTAAKTETGKDAKKEAGESGLAGAEAGSTGRAASSTEKSANTDNTQYIENSDTAGSLETSRNREGMTRSAQANSVRGVLLSSTSTEYIQRTKDILRRKALILQLIMLVVVFIASFLLSGFLVRPFEILSRDIREVKEGYSNEPIEAPQYIETMHIADSFNNVLGRMNALDQSRQEFVANVSHELKTPMTSMKVLASSLLSEETVDPAMYREFLEDIDSEIDRENKIISDLLALVKEDRTDIDLTVSSIDINLLAEAVMKRLRPIARQRDIELTLVNRQEVRAEVDATRINLVLTNLVENAIKYNREHGEVIVTVDADGEYFQMNVHDNGIGIPEDQQGRIFERFYRVDKSRSREIGGTGLGLSITKSAVLRHHGTITLESTEGEGTTFYVRIPLEYSSQPMELRVGKQRRQISRLLRRGRNAEVQRRYMERTIHVSRRKHEPEEKKETAAGGKTPDADGVYDLSVKSGQERRESHE